MTCRPAPMVCHVLLVETDNGLVRIVLVSGSHDCLRLPRTRGSAPATSIRPVLRHRNRRTHATDSFPARRRAPLMHQDASRRRPPSRLSDFPAAKVHSTAPRRSAPSVASHERGETAVRPAQWSHIQRVEHHPTGESGGDSPLPRDSPLLLRIALVALPATTRGHACVRRRRRPSLDP